LNAGTGRKGPQLAKPASVWKIEKNRDREKEKEVAVVLENPKLKLEYWVAEPNGWLRFQ
jgi:hypothetical protein